MMMQTNTGGGFKKALGRFFAGESIFLNEYTPGNGSGMIAFASGFPGSIMTSGNGVIVQKRGLPAMEKGLNLSVYLRERLFLFRQWEKKRVSQVLAHLKNVTFWDTF